MRIHNVKKIAVVRANGLGDFIFALPALAAIKQTYPSARLYYLGKKWHKDFLKKRKSPIDTVIVIPPVQGVGMSETYSNDQEQLQKFFNTMQEEKFDIAIQLHGGGMFSNVFVKQLVACYTVGSKTQDAIALDFIVPYHYYQNEHLRLLEVVGLIDAKASTLMPHITVTEQDKQEASRVLGEKQSKLLVLHPGATDIKRRWPKEYFAIVGRYFLKKGFRIVVTGNGNEKNLVDDICKNIPATNVCNKLSLNGLTGLFSTADLIISNDTGPLHLADAIGCKTVGLYWCGNMFTASPPFRQHTVVLSSWITHCPLCHKSLLPYGHLQKKEKSSCQHTASIVSDITTEEVIEAAENLLFG